MDVTMVCNKCQLYNAFWDIIELVKIIVVSQSIPSYLVHTVCERLIQNMVFVNIYILKIVCPVLFS